jgi:alpha-L-arabinofuranosidase
VRSVAHAVVGVVWMLTTVGCHHAGAQRNRPSEDVNHGVTNIAIGTSAAQTGLKRLGMNIGSQNFYDTGQMLRNLVARNPGFEGEMWQSILRCKVVTPTSCTDANQWNQWPLDFLKGAQYEFISGSAEGSTGTVIASIPADSRVKDQGITVLLTPPAKPMAVGDFLIVKKAFPGDAEAGWWTDNGGGGVFSTDADDISPNSPGKQALRISTSGGRNARLTSYFDSGSGPGHSFLLMHGMYRVSFRAKGVGGKNDVEVSLGRDGGGGKKIYFKKEVGLSKQWKDYSFDFPMAEEGSAVGTAALQFQVIDSDILLDDVSLGTLPSAENPTAFRDEVVEALRTLHLGVLRYHDDATYGSTIDNIIAPAFARLRSGYTTRGSKSEDVAIGLHEFLQLCQAVGAEPYYDMPAGMSPKEMQELIEYLGGEASTPYGAKRAARGQSAPWTAVFPVIHLELGNEQWNYDTFPGAAINDAASYGKRIATVYGAAKSANGYNPAKIDLVMGSFAILPWWTEQEIANASNYDSISVAPYLLNTLNDTTSNEAMFGPMFAQPEQVDTNTPKGYMFAQAKAAKGAGKNLEVYEVQLSTLSGTATQAAVNSVVPSVGAGLAVADHMLLMMRDLGVKVQSVWELPGYNNNFGNPADPHEKTPLFGVVVDMGGSTNLRRTPYLAEELVNQAILPTMLTTTLSGANPTWQQAKSTNDDIQLDKAHFLQSFAFADGAQRSLVVFNLSRTEALPITLSGNGAPAGEVAMSRLTAKNITDNNETRANVAIAESKLSGFSAATPYSLPPFSMTVLRWTAAH